MSRTPILIPPVFPEPRKPPYRCRGMEHVMLMALGRCDCFGGLPCAPGQIAQFFRGCDECAEPGNPIPPGAGQTVVAVGACGEPHRIRSYTSPINASCSCDEDPYFCDPEDPYIELRGLSHRPAYDTVMYFRERGPSVCCPEI